MPTPGCMVSLELNGGFALRWVRDQLHVFPNLSCV